MNPEEYFTKYYLKDFDQFGDSEKSMCGATLSEMSDELISSYHNFEHFIICEYELNLLSQTIHSHFIEDHQKWMETTAPYHDARCYHAGGHPITVLINTERATRKNREPIVFNRDLILGYDKYFLQYLEGIISKHNFSKLTAKAFLEALIQDPDSKTPAVVRFFEKRY